MVSGCNLGNLGVALFNGASIAQMGAGLDHEIRLDLEIGLITIYIYTWTRHQGRIVVPSSSGPVQAFSWGSCRGPLFDPRDSVEHFLPYPRVFFEFCSLLGLLFITNRHYFSYVFSCDATCANRAPV